MGNAGYSSISRSAYEDRTELKTTNEIFKQNVEKKVHADMNPMNLGIREARDSENHPESIAVIIALDETGSMGHIPERIVRKDLSKIAGSLIEAGLKDLQIMFMGIGDHISDDAPLQVGQFESGDQELAMWLENTWLEGHGGPFGQESYGLAWLVGGHHTSIDCLEKRGQKGFLFTIGDEAFHENYNVSGITGAKQSYSAQQLLDAAREKYHVYHIHAAYSHDGPHITNPWKEIMGQHLLRADNDLEITSHIVNTIAKTLKITPVIDKGEGDSPAPDTSEKPDIML